MGIISWADIRRGTLAIILVILPTYLISVYLTPHLRTYHISESDLWELERENIPNTVTKPLHEIGLEKFFFKYRLMSLVESRISNKELYKRYENKIANKISDTPIWGFEYFFLIILGSFYGFLWLFTRKFFPEVKI